MFKWNTIDKIVLKYSYTNLKTPNRILVFQLCKQIDHLMISNRYHVFIFPKKLMNKLGLSWAELG